VYRAVLRSTGEAVAVKVQRPALLPIVTRDLYVMKRAVAVRQPYTSTSTRVRWSTPVYIALEWCLYVYTCT
jgi:predicted unusual protein kinase regulating ubiquinone biosynthesis (AarF/ABC1/UbiB family)